MRLDVFRGLCLVMIFINHVPGNPYEVLTSRNFGFTDAAEGFVMMSGVAAGLAYSLDFRLPGRFLAGLTRIWKRCWTLYQAHLLVVAVSLGVVSAVTLITGDLRPLHENLMRWIWIYPREVLVGVPLLTHQFGYMNILPLYTVLLLASPLVLWGLWRQPRLVLALSAALWVATGLWGFNLPNYPVPGGWFFNPFAWQLVFVTGLAIGVAMKDGRRLVAVRRGLQWAAALYLAHAALATLCQPCARPMQESLAAIARTGVLPWTFTSFDKTFETLPRLLHILSLTYLLSSLATVRAICASRWLAPLGVLGRQSLPVFAFGTILCLGLQAIKETTLGNDALIDTALVGAGLAAQFALAYARVYWPQAPKVVHHPGTAPTPGA